MALVGIGTIIFMLTFVMPRLMGIFDSMGQGLPLPTKILISLSNALRQYGFWIVVVLFVFILLIKRELRTRQGKLFFSILKLRIPVLGNLTLKSELARFSRTLELLIKSGIPILKAIDISIPVLENEVLKNHFRQSYKELEQGGSFGRSLKNSRVFPSFMSNLLIVGEESGKLDESLSELATSYERDTEEAMRIFASLLEPMMILIMGLAVGFIVVAMLLPIFEINVMVR
jgi:type II secretory pathway component PulF